MTVFVLMPLLFEKTTVWRRFYRRDELTWSSLLSLGYGVASTLPNKLIFTEISKQVSFRDAFFAFLAACGLLILPIIFFIKNTAVPFIP